MPSAESYISGGEYTITLDGFVLAFEAGSMWDEWSVDEMTNSKTQRHYDDVKTIRRGGLTGVRAVYEKGIPPTFKAGDIVSCVVAGPSGQGPSCSGNVRIGRMDYPVVDIRAGIRYNFDAMFKGVFTMTHG
jgi:hypothetical protein